MISISSLNQLLMNEVWRGTQQQHKSQTNTECQCQSQNQLPSSRKHTNSTIKATKFYE